MLYIVVAVSVMCLFNNCLSETSESSYFIGGNRQNEKYNYKKGQDKNYTVDSPLTEFIQSLKIQKYHYSGQVRIYHKIVMQTKISRNGWSSAKFSRRIWNTNHYLNKDVITDGLLPNFPVEYGDINRRYSSSTEKSAETYPVQSNAGSTHPSVGLTVLPSVKNSNVNMSTSQGEVSQGLQTSVTKVDHDRSSFRRRKRTKIVKSNVIEDNDMQSANRITSTDEKQNYLDSSAVAAAVGAGMIPATMALLVPFAMGSKENRSINK
ncbi:hypothetical protein QE152_g38321 [Popillia japonica]|uniref:Uncharacterized protein n=1 Tax=Popillia japonica TaxID=7064 RepID=A0AAW1I6R1_POPJA